MWAIQLLYFFLVYRQFHEYFLGGWVLEILLGYKITEENELLLLWKMQMHWRRSPPE